MRTIRKLTSPLFSLLLAPICFVRTFAFVLIHWRMFRVGRVYVFHHHSFGHTISGLDYVSRLFYPNPVSLLYVGSPGSNPYLSECFAHNLIPHSLISRTPIFRSAIPRLNYLCARMICHWVASFRTDVSIIDRAAMYKTISLAHGKTLVGNEERDQKFSADDWTGYLHLLHNHIGRPPQLPAKLLERCETEIKRKFSKFFDRPFATLLLRQKGDGDRFDNFARCSGPQRNYRPAIERLVGEGYHVVGAGETDHAVFSDISGYLNLSELDLPPKLINLYLLSQCAIFIGQQSGPSVLPNSLGIPSLICDALPHRIGTFFQGDIILFKQLKLSSGTLLSLSDIYRDHQDLALGYGFARKGVEILPNTSDEILDGIQEVIAIQKKRLQISDRDQELIQKFFRLVPSTMTLHYQKNRPPLSILRSLETQLAER